MEITQSSTDLTLSPYVISFLTDNIILLRYVEIAGQFKKSLVVVKMRNSNHSNDLMLYEITPHGMIVRESLDAYDAGGVDTAKLREASRRPTYPGLTAEETMLLQALIELREAPAELLARRAGLPVGPQLTAALDRLVSLAYAAKLDEATRTYRPVAQVLG